MRHFAIYQRPWPSRVAPRGTICETPPREETPVEVITKKVTQKSLSVLDRKIAAAASASNRKSNKHSRVEEEEEARSAKRRKSEPEPVLQKAKVTRTYSSSASKKLRRPISPEPEEEEDDDDDEVTVEEPAKRKRGRPRLVTPAQVKLEESADADKSVLSQPRSNNGRFGRKDKARRGGRGDSASSSGSPTNQTRDGDGMEDDDRKSGRRRKRSYDDLDEDEEYPHKKPFVQAVDYEAAMQRVLPRPMSGFRGGRLFSNPNPLQYALHAWAGPVVLDDSSSSSDDEKHPDTPDDADSLAPGIATPTHDEDISPYVPILTYKPSPFAFAKTRWNGKQTYAAPKVSIAEKRAYLADEEVSPRYCSLEFDHSYLPYLSLFGRTSRSPPCAVSVHLVLARTTTRRPFCRTVRLLVNSDMYTPFSTPLPLTIPCPKAAHFPVKTRKPSPHSYTRVGTTRRTFQNHEHHSHNLTQPM